MPRYMILDSETENHTSRKRKANPFDKRNWIVMRGWKLQGDTRGYAEHYGSRKEVQPINIPDDVDVIVAHNAKFDLLYEQVFSHAKMHAFFKRGGRVWCTQYAEYLLNAQDPEFHMVSLDAIVEKYGGRKKIDGVKALWEAGVLTSQIDPDLLFDYLVGTLEEGRNSGDIGNTELVYLGQLVDAEARGMTTAIMRRMDGLCATMEMEYRGLKVDVQAAAADLAARTAELEQASEQLRSFVPELPDGLQFNFGSNVHLSSLIFGGTVRYQKRAPYLDEETGELARKKETERWPMFDGECIALSECVLRPDGLYQFVEEGVEHHVRVQDTYKSGKQCGAGKFKNVAVPGELKQKYQDFFFTLPGYTTPNSDWKTEQKDASGGPVYSTSAEVIEQLANRNVPFLRVLGRWQALSKEIGTYYARYDEGKRTVVGALTCMDNETHVIHHKLNHVNTVTSRLSSSDPNMQNVPRADFDKELGRPKSTVKRMFVSRFAGGKMIEIDYSQLEVVVQGLLSLDPKLVADINAKVDFHCKRVSLREGCTYDEARLWCKDEAHPKFEEWSVFRTECKVFSFQRAYGAGAQKISDSTGIPIERVQAMIEAEEREYSGVVDFNKRVTHEVETTAEPFRDPKRGYRVFRRGTYQAPTGCMYSFRSYDAPDYARKRGIVDTFMPTEIKNYPTQGTGGELVQLALGMLWRHFVSVDFYDWRAFLVNTVHDCVWTDTAPEVTEQVARACAKIMESIPLYLRAFYNLDCPVPFPVDVKTGPDMLNLSHFKI